MKNLDSRKYQKYWRYSCLAIGLLYLITLLSLILFTGLENYILFLKSQYKSYFIKFTLTFASIAIFFILGFLIVEKKINLKFFSTKTKFLHLEKILPTLALTGYMVFANYALGKYFHYFEFKKENFSKEYKNQIGPFVQLDLNQGSQKNKGRINYIIWWFDPEKRTQKSFLKIGLNPVENQMANIYETSGDGKRHKYYLKNLRPASRYYYKIPEFNNKVYYFLTEPVSNSDKPFHILSVGDTRNSGGKTNSFYKEINLEATRFYSKEKIAPVFKLHLGDTNFGGRDMHSWQKYFTDESIHSPYLPIVITVGNHEIKGDYGGNYGYIIDQPWYFSFDYANAHFLVIHTFDGLFHTTGKKQYDFIEKDLKQNAGKKWLIVSMHIPPLSTGDYNFNKFLIGQYFELFRKYKVDLVLTGHDHHYDSFWVDKEQHWGGTIYLVNGGGGSNLDYYIMRKSQKKWNRFFHDRDSIYGLYQKDELARKYHVYGELSWGFLDIEIGKTQLITSYYRWLDLETYLKISEQNLENPKIFPLDKIKRKYQNSLRSKLAHRLSKRRTFD